MHSGQESERDPKNRVTLVNSRSSGFDEEPFGAVIVTVRSEEKLTSHTRLPAESVLAYLVCELLESAGGEEGRALAIDVVDHRLQGSIEVD